MEQYAHTRLQSNTQDLDNALAQTSTLAAPGAGVIGGGLASNVAPQYISGMQPSVQVISGSAMPLISQGAYISQPAMTGVI
jgi:hypothetical protein